MALGACIRFQGNCVIASSSLRHFAKLANCLIYIMLLIHGTSTPTSKSGHREFDFKYVLMNAHVYVCISLHLTLNGSVISC